MFSCDVQVSQPPDANVKDAIDDTYNIIEFRNTKIPTKIPEPVRLDRSGCCIHRSTRKYIRLMKSLQSKSKLDESYNSSSTLVYTCNDSGVQMDFSTAKDDELIIELLSRDSDSSTSQLHCSTETLPQSESLLELKAAEEQTLRVLQLAVAEMEADVELNAQILEEQIKLELGKHLNLEVEQIVEHEIEQMPLQEELQVEPTVELVEEVPEEVSEEIPQELVKEPPHELLKMLPHKLSAELTEKLAKHPEPKEQFVDLIEPIDQIEKLSNSILTPRERKYVRMEQLLEAENNIQMLHKLLQPNSETNLVQHPEGEFVLADTDKERLEIIPDNESEWTSKNGLLQSLLTFICSKSILKLSYPILLCGMAVGLVYYFHKD
ncbi:GH11028 [Drosophila grimshawi]|uniref:GH11028 n=2 Tax=Drosophila grimshawi TaxID=7222 RepID=B4JC38_DROGR|nr:GH11028 [Drosophila grimshawi]